MGKHAAQKRYGLSLAVMIGLFLFANWLDYQRYRKLVPGYDYLIGYGVPFEFFVKGGTLDLKHAILWHAVAANLVTMIGLAALLAWVSSVYSRGRAG